MFHMMTFIFPSFLIALSLNIPKWLEFEHITRCHYNLPAPDNKVCILCQPGEHHPDSRGPGADTSPGLRHHGAQKQSELCLLLHTINPVDRHYYILMIIYRLCICKSQAAVHWRDTVCVPCLRQYQHHLDNLQIT